MDQLIDPRLKDLPALAASGSVSTMLATLLTLCASLGLRAEVTESGRLRLSEAACGRRQTN